MRRPVAAADVATPCVVELTDSYDYDSKRRRTRVMSRQSLRAICAACAICAIAALFVIVAQATFGRSDRRPASSSWPLRHDRPAMSPLAAFFLASGPKGTLACEDRPQAGFGNCLAGMYSTLLMSKLLNRTWVRSDMSAYAFARPGPNES